MPTGGWGGVLRICKTVPLQGGKKEGEENEKRKKKGGLFCILLLRVLTGSERCAASGEVDLFDNHNGTLLNLRTAYVSQ